MNIVSTQDRVIWTGVMGKERVINLLRRGTNALDVEWQAAATGPIKDVTKKRFFGIGRDINIRLTMGQAELGLEGGRAIVLTGPLVESCYRAIPKGFRFSSFALSQDPVGQEEVDRRAKATQDALKMLAEHLGQNLGHYKIRFG
jgi:hypothetical protein